MTFLLAFHLLAGPTVLLLQIKFCDQEPAPLLKHRRHGGVECWVACAASQAGRRGCGVQAFAFWLFKNVCHRRGLEKCGREPHALELRMAARPRPPGAGDGCRLPRGEGPCRCATGRDTAEARWTVGRDGSQVPCSWPQTGKQKHQNFCLVAVVVLTAGSGCSRVPFPSRGCLCMETWGIVHGLWTGCPQKLLSVMNVGDSSSSRSLRTYLDAGPRLCAACVIHSVSFIRMEELLILQRTLRHTELSFYVWGPEVENS